jgi:hypothetical protein
MGDIAAAFQTAQVIDDLRQRAWTLGVITNAQVQAGSIAAALQTAQQIDVPEERAKALKGIAEAQMQAGDITSAQSTLASAQQAAQQIDFSEERAKALKMIAVTQVQTEDITAAYQTDQLIEDESERAETLEAIAFTLAKAGLSEQALLVAEKILINRNKHLPNIAAPLVETEDKENFKQLLIPCAYYLDAAYKMCGHLAKLYPAQATAVAEVVSNINKVKEVTGSNNIEIAAQRQLSRFVG